MGLLTDRVAMIRAAAEHGCHIYTEKPLAHDLAAADAIRDECQAHKIKLALAHQWRAMPPVQYQYTRAAGWSPSLISNGSYRQGNDEQVS